MADVLLERSLFLSDASSSSGHVGRSDSYQEASLPDVVFDECQYEGMYCWVASEQSRTVIVGGPSAVLKNIHQPNSDATRSDPSLNPAPSQEEGDMPTVPLNLYVEPGTALKLPRRDRIIDQATFRNPKFRMEVALSAVIFCCERWGPERQRLQGSGGADKPCTAKRPASVESIISRCGSLKESDGAKRLREFDVITSRRSLRSLLRFLYPDSTPYLQPFAIDVDIAGKTIVLTTITETIKAKPTGYGVDFEERFVLPASLDTRQVPCAEQQIRGTQQELTSMYVVYSVRLCGTMRLAISGETDAVDPQFNPIRGTVPLASCCCSNSAGSGRQCVFSRQVLATNECYVHSCEQLSLLEEQLIQGVAPLVELKSHAEDRGLAWQETAAQMRLGGAKLLLKGSHHRGALSSLQLLPVESVQREAQGQNTPERVKWQSLMALLQKLQEVAESARARSGENVGCVRVTFDGRSTFLRVSNRRAESLRLSREAASWLA